MPETIEQRVERFVGYYQRAADAAANLSGDSHIPKLRKICLLAVLDAMAKAVYPNRESRGRFTQLLQRFGNWPHGRRISLPHLAALLSRCPEPDFEDIRAFTNTKLGRWMPGSIVGLEHDPEHEEVRSRWPRDPALRMPVADITIDHLQHVHLLYTFRNLLVHEFRDQGDPIGEERRDVPYYVHFRVIDYEAETERWHLFYPSGFLRVLVDVTLANVKAYLISNRLDPSLHFGTGEYLLEALYR